MSKYALSFGLLSLCRFTESTMILTTFNLSEGPLLTNLRNAVMRFNGWLLDNNLQSLFAERKLFNITTTTNVGIIIKVIMHYYVCEASHWKQIQVLLC
jgi:hypothetical protein